MLGGPAAGSARRQRHTILLRDQRPGQFLVEGIGQVTGQAGGDRLGHYAGAKTSLWIVEVAKNIGPAGLHRFPQMAQRLIHQVPVQRLGNTRLEQDLRSGGQGPFVPHPPLQRLLGLLAGGDILLDGDIVAGVARPIPHRRDDGRFPVVLAILSLVEQLSLPDLAPGDGLPELCVDLFGHPPRLEDARILPHRLGGGVAGDARKGRIHELDGALQVGDEDRAPRLFDGSGEGAQLRFRLPALGYVDRDAA